MRRAKRHRVAVREPAHERRHQRPVSWWRRIVRCGRGALLLAGIAVVYAPSLTNGFTYDDPSVIAEASDVLSDPRLLPRLLSTDYFRLSNESTYRPVVTLSYALDWQIGTGRAWVFHLQSLLWHLAAVGGLLLLLRRLGAGPVVRYTSAALYGIHPAITEAVDSIAFREDILVTTLGLLALLVTVGEWPRRATVRMLLGTALFAAALFSKESAVAFAFLLPLTHWAMARQQTASSPWRPWRHRHAYLGWSLCLLAYLVVRFALLPSPQAYGHRIGDSLGLSFATGVVAVGYYLRLLLYPYGLSADYRGVVAVVTSGTDWRFWLSAMVILGLTVVAWRWRRQNVLGWWGWAWFLAAIAPVSNVIPIPVFMGERYLHLPFVGLAVFAVASAGALATLAPEAPLIRSSRLRLGASLGIAAATMLVLGALTWTRHSAWSSDEVLWRTTLADHPSSYGALHGYGAALIEMKRYDEGITYLQRVLEDKTANNERRAAVHLELGVAHDAMGHPEMARTSFEHSLVAAPTPKAHLSLAIALVRLGNLPDAERHLRAALRLDPAFAEAHSALGAVFARQGRSGTAIAEWREAIRLKPSVASAHANLGLALAADERPDEAIDAFLTALAIQPSQARWRYIVGTLLAERGRADAAIQQFEAALGLDPGLMEAREALQKVRRP